MNPAGSDPLDLGPEGPVLNIRAFRCGSWNLVPTTADDVRDLAANFALFAAPLDSGHPFLVPCVSVFHDDGLSFGRVTAVRAAGEFLDLDIDGVPLLVRRWMKGDRLTSPSIEFWDPGRFIAPGGKRWPTRVLKLVTLLGSEPPGAKGLPPLSAATYPGLDDRPADGAVILPSALTPAALTKYRPTEGVSKFSDHAPATRSGGRRVMTPERQKLIDALQAAGLAPELVTEATPDTLLQGFLGCIQKAAQDPPKPPAPDTGVQKFRDQLGREQTVTVPVALLPMAQGFAALMDQLHATNTANAAVQAKSALEARREKVRRFRDEMTRPDDKGHARMTPAQFDAVEKMLVNCDDSGVRKFADGKTDGTEMDEQFAALRSSFAEPVRKFADQMGQERLAGNAATATDAPPPVRNPAVAPKAADISPEVKAMLESAGFGHQLANLTA